MESPHFFNAFFRPIYALELTGAKLCKNRACHPSGFSKPLNHEGLQKEANVFRHFRLWVWWWIWSVHGCHFGVSNLKTLRASKWSMIFWLQSSKSAASSLAECIAPLSRL